MEPLKVLAFDVFVTFALDHEIQAVVSFVGGNMACMASFEQLGAYMGGLTSR